MALKPLMKTMSCDVPPLQYHFADRLVVGVMDDGS